MKFIIGKVTQNWAQKSQIPTWYASTATSTNQVAKTEVVAEEPVTLYLTDHQTEGRGRGNNTWTDPEAGGQALLSSWVFQMRRAPQPVLSPAIGLAIWKAFSASFPWLRWSLKAPNDLYLGDRKIAGLLIENVQHASAHRLIVGLGANIWKAPDAVSTSTSLRDFLEEDLLTESSWFNLLDRLLLEISLAVSETSFELSLAQQKSLLHVLNLFPNLEQAYDKVYKDGSLWRGAQKINWSEL